jgi:hypothetical protein
MSRIPARRDAGWGGVNALVVPGSGALSLLPVSAGHAAHLARIGGTKLTLIEACE